MVKLGIKKVDIEVRGDSKIALAWAKSNVTKGGRAATAAVIFKMLCLMFGINVKETSHISAKDNYRCDRLSRLIESGQEIISLMYDFGFKGKRILQLESDTAVISLIEHCNPFVLFNNEGDFATFWNSIKDAMENR